MRDWNRERQDILYNKKLQNVKSTLPKALTTQGHPIQKKKQPLPQQTSHQKQHNLKYLLREFGLIQYLRKMYELGYDDNSLMKLGLLTQKEFEELLFNLKIFPGHQVKMQNMHQYIKQTMIHNSIPFKKPGSSNAMRSPMTSTTHQRKAKSYSAKQKFQYIPNTNTYDNSNVKKEPNANPMLSSFMRGDFGYDYYCANNNDVYDYNTELNQIGIANINGIESNNYLIKDSSEKEKNINSNSKKDDDKDETEGNDINNDIDALLNYYMAQLNEKLDNSLDSIEDSSLSNNHFNEIVRKEEEINKGKMVEKKKEVNVDNNQDNILENISEIKINSNSDNSLAPIKAQKEQIDKSKDQVHNCPKDQEDNETKDKEDDIIEEFFERKDKEEEKEEAETEKQQQGNDKESITNTNQELYYTRISKTEGNEKQNDQNHNYTNSNNQTYSNQQTENIEEERQNYSKEQIIYDNIRLTKSYEGESIRQNPEQFDIEYMCRCLALAIMKHLESSKDKTHITDLLNQNETFTFFNSLYNSNVSFLHNFFNKDKSSPDQISNLDRLDLVDKAKELPRPQISFMKHISKEGDQVAKGDEKKKYQHIKDIDSNIKFIDEFFSVSKKIRYKNLSERTMSVLNKELSYINEVDSNLSSKLDNSNLTHKKETSENILRQSLQQIIMKSNNENDDSGINHNQNQTEPNKDIGNKYGSLSEESNYNHTPLNANIIQEEINDDNQINSEVFESGEMESNYAIDATTVDKLKHYLLKQAEVYDDDYLYSAQRIQTRKYIGLPDPQIIFEFCANIMILTKMEKEVIIVALIYLERLIFNTGLLLTSRNWRRITFTVLIIASKIWDDDSFENNHFAQVFTHLKIGEINLLERIYLELINYKVYVKCSEYFKYFFIIKSIALKYNYNGNNLIPISVEHMMKIQEYAFQMQNKIKKKCSLSNSAQF